MGRSVLSLDDINLLKNSEEPKNAELYGNLYKILCNLDKPKAVTLEQLPDLDDLAKAALTYNKKTLIDTVIKEWYAERVSEEDPAKKVRCGLCNTPNKYLYYIRNRKNGILLNVGSRCIMKFPGIEGYIEQKKQLNQIHKGHMVIARRNNFYDKFHEPEQFIADADKYFSALPILLPYDLYSKFEDTITRMRIIYTKYVNEGKKPFESKYDSFELFQLAANQYQKLKSQSDIHISKAANNTLICKRKEIDWMISNNKQQLLQQIAENNGEYTRRTLQQMYSSDYFKEKLDIFIKRNMSEFFKIKSVNESEIIFSFDKFGYQPEILFSTSLNEFMCGIGANCVIDCDYTYSDEDILRNCKIIQSKKNLQSIINYIDDIMNKLNCAFIIDDETNSLLLYRRGDRSIRQFKFSVFLNSYVKYILLPDDKIREFLFMIVKGNSLTKWITPQIQSKQGIDDKINKLYKVYRDSHSHYNTASVKQLELLLYSTIIDPVLGTTIINFDKPKYVFIPKEQCNISNTQIRLVNYGIRISDDSLYPFYQKGDILLIQDTQYVKDGDLIFFVSRDGLETESVYTEEDHENIFSYIRIKKNELQSYGKIIHCLRSKKTK